MELITIDRTNYTTGSIVNDIDSFLWVERYLDPGEFKIVCDPTPALRTQLALGTFVSHVDTPEVMIVENHEIKETFGQTPKLEVTGRSLDCFLEKRIVSTTQSAFNQTTGNAIDYQYNAYPAAQGSYLLNQFLTGSILYADNVVPNVNVIVDTNAPTTPAFQNSIKKGENLAKVVIDILKVGNLGIRFERPMRDKTGTPIHHYNATTDPNATKMALYIHTGVDRSGTVSFFYDSGDIKDARYFWSNKEELNYIHGSTYYVTWDEKRDGATKTGWDNKTGYVDVTAVNVKPVTLADAAFQQEAIKQKAQELLANASQLTLMEATISPNAKYAYRKDYIVGDTVYVVGNYGVSSKMRVIENVESQDETGYSSYPTLGSIS